MSNGILAIGAIITAALLFGKRKVSPAPPAPTDPATPPVKPPVTPPPALVTPKPVAPPTPPPPAPGTLYHFTIQSPSGGAQPPSGRYPAGTSLTLNPGRMEAGYHHWYWEINGKVYLPKDPKIPLTITMDKDINAVAWRQRDGDNYIMPTAIAIECSRLTLAKINELLWARISISEVIPPFSVPDDRCIKLKDGLTGETYGFVTPWGSVGHGAYYTIYFGTFVHKQDPMEIGYWTGGGYGTPGSKYFSTFGSPMTPYPPGITPPVTGDNSSND
jgi:hypothetical protein